MYSTIKSLLVVVLLSGFAFSQQGSRDQKIQNIFDLRSQITNLEKDIIQPDTKDIALAQQLGFSAIRLLPGEKYGGILGITGGGAYYSFAMTRQPYGSGSDIRFEQGYLSVGFAGADYGFLRDLGNVSLSDINKDSLEVNALIKYTPPSDEPSIRAEYRKLWKGYEVNGVNFISRLPAIVEHTFLLRSVNIDRSDVLVAFNVLRKDTDGSLVLLWKPLETFAKPEMQRQQSPLDQ